MPERNHTTTYPQSYVPAIPADGGTVILPPVAPRVVQAGNQASSPGVAAVAFAVVLVIALTVGLAGWGFLRWDARLAFVASVALAIPGALVVLIVVNGDFPAWREIVHGHRTERIRMELEAGAHADKLAAWVAAEDHRHTEEMARIEAHSQHSRVSADVAWLLDQVGEMRRALLTVGAPTEPQAKPDHAFVPARSDDARLAAEKWLAGLWFRGTEPRFVQGKLPMPWNGEWRGQPWCDDARRLLLDSGILVPNASGRTYTVVPASRIDAMTMLDTIR